MQYENAKDHLMVKGMTPTIHPTVAVMVMEDNLINLLIKVVIFSKGFPVTNKKLIKMYQLNEYNNLISLKKCLFILNS